MAGIAETLRAMRRRRRRRWRLLRMALGGAVRFLLLCAVYLLLVGQVASDEAVAAVLCGAAAAVVPLLVAGVAERQFDYRRVPWARLATGAARAIVHDVLHVGARLARWTIPGCEVERRRFDEIDAQQPDVAARRGLTTLATSLAPNGYVLAVLPARGELLVHRLVPAEPARDARWPL